VVDIGRDTGKMFKSFTPGNDDVPSGATDQIFETPPGRVVVGTNVPYATKFSESRPFWPRGGKMPTAWAREINEALERAIVKAVVIIAQRGGI
jgi:hypothetical protein